MRDTGDKYDTRIDNDNKFAKMNREKSIQSSRRSENPM